MSVNTWRSGPDICFLICDLAQYLKNMVHAHSLDLFKLLHSFSSFLMRFCWNFISRKILFQLEKSPCKWLICTLPNPGSLYWPEIFFVPLLYKIFSCMKTFWLRRTCNYWLKFLFFNYKTDWWIFALICFFTFSR